ncbi:ATP-binding protein [Sphingomonas sp. BT-65]|uniref:ATP-binding protein n=1 Tax=Sphingomonas sp. BT-65 TaxID=2989821 RepID=UPI002236BF8E|nr:ATP-binding protein [Sphingomonas sp. BT-65]MCW4460960.1 ATP-binding protein [Sphingomonas sp. BT-65]
MHNFGTITLPKAIDRPLADGDRIARAADLLRAHIAFEPQPAITPVDLDRLLGEAGSAPWSALDRVARVFELDRFETALLLTLAAASVDPALAATCAALQGQERSGAISFALAGRLLPEARLAALRPDAPLRLWRLIVPAGPAEAASVTRFQIDEHVLFHLAGAEIASEYLAPLPADGWLAPSQRACVEQVAALLDLDDPRGGTAVQLCGEDGGTLRALAAATGGRLGLPVLALTAAALPTARTELIELARACSRDLALAEAMLLLDASGASADAGGAAAQFAALVEAPVMIAAPAPLAVSGRPALRLDVPPPTLAERREHWRELAPQLAPSEIGLLARTFLLDGASRTAAARLAGASADRAALWQACRMQARDRLEGLAERIVSPVGWEDLVLPDAQHELLRDIVDHVTFAGRVFEDWGFDTRLSRGTGVAALFAGPSGTGKTLAAEVLANALERDLYRIDLSQVVSKYIGETEKNLSRIFAAAEGGGAILLFDEADALFGKRSEVQDSHDRYANIEVSYLLQRMETYAGLSILTTNLKDALDKAFLRRLRFIVQFAYPNAEQRGRIWERAFPAELPREGIDYARLAQYDLTGGAIRNVALAAAFLAARSGGPLTMAHCAAAAAREYRKLEKPLGARELGRGR